MVDARKYVSTQMAPFTVNVMETKRFMPTTSYVQVSSRIY